MNKDALVRWNAYRHPSILRVSESHPNSNIGNYPDGAAHTSIPTGNTRISQKNVAAGEVIQFHISSQGPCLLSMVRLGWDVSGPSRDWVIQEFPESPGAVQPICPCSYVHVPDALPSSASPAISLECWVRPKLNKWQGFCFNQGVGTLWVNGVLESTVIGPTTVNPGSAPLRLAAYGASGLTGNCLDGDLAMPVIYGRAMEAGEIHTRANTKAPVIPQSAGLLGCWPMTEENGSATWMIGGPDFVASAIDRFGSYDPSVNPEKALRGHALRFASDDLFDCG